MADISQIKLPSGSVYNIKDTVARQMLASLSVTVAWDGTAAPVASAIPAGVKVTYNGNVTTGTLAATSTNASPRSFYLIKSSSTPSDDNLDIYDEYVIVKPSTSSSTWFWEKIGDTKINLSNILTNVVLEQDSTNVIGTAATISVTNPKIKLETTSTPITDGKNNTVAVLTGIKSASVGSANIATVTTATSPTTTEAWKTTKLAKADTTATGRLKYVEAQGTATSTKIKAELNLGTPVTSSVAKSVTPSIQKLETIDIVGLNGTQSQSAVLGRTKVVVMSSATTAPTSQEANAQWLKGLSVANEVLTIGSVKMTTQDVYEADSPSTFSIPKAASSKKVATGSISTNGTGGSVVTSVTVQSSDSIAVPMSYGSAGVAITTGEEGDLTVVTGMGNATTKYMYAASSTTMNAVTADAIGTTEVLGKDTTISVTPTATNIKATAGDGSAGFDSKDSKTVLTTNTSITLTNGEGE